MTTARRSALPRGARPRGGLLPALAQARSRLQAHVAPRWQALAARERLAVLVAATAVGLLLLWTLGVAPALTTLREAPPAKAALQLQLSQMQALAAETTELRKQPVLTPAQAETALRAATARLGAVAQLSITGNRATVRLIGIDGTRLLAWLGEVRSAARAKPVEAQLNRTGELYGGSLVLSLPGG